MNENRFNYPVLFHELEVGDRFTWWASEYVCEKVDAIHYKYIRPAYREANGQYQVLSLNAQVYLHIGE